MKESLVIHYGRLKKERGDYFLRERRKVHDIHKKTEAVKRKGGNAGIM